MVSVMCYCVFNIKFKMNGGEINMINKIDGIMLFSENAKKLADFYKEKVGLERVEEMVAGENDENVFLFSFGDEGTGFGIMDHSRVKGKNQNPERFIVNLEVNDIEEEVKKLDKANVKKIQDTYHIEGYGLIATFEDVDGNYFQLVQIRENGGN